MLNHNEINFIKTNKLFTCLSGVYPNSCMCNCLFELNREAAKLLG